MRRQPSGSSWSRAQNIADEALAGSVYAPIGYATHYHTLWVNPYWASSLDHVGTIGAHRFYRTRGASGESSAFTGPYAGVEPGVSGTATTGTAQSTPAAAPRLSDTAQTAPSPEAAPSTPLADPSFTGAGQVREDYANAGQWKSDAAREALLAEEEALARERAEGPSGPQN